MPQQGQFTSADLDQPAVAPAPTGKFTAEDIDHSDSFWDRVKAAFSDSSLTDQAHAAYDKKQGKLEMPGSFEGHPENIGEYVPASAGEIYGGAKDIVHGDIAKGTHRVIGGVGAGIAPAAALTLPAVAMAAPVTTALSIGGGIAGKEIAHAGAEALGASPDQADVAGDVGGIAGGFAGSKLPSLGTRAILLGRTPASAYQSALKPSTTLPPAKVASMVQTGLENKIPVSKAGGEKIASLLEDLQDKVTAEIGAGKGRTIDPQAVANRTDSLKKQFSNQVNPDEDLKAIDASKAEFLKNNPSPIPAADAQAMKIGTYRQLGGKAYGEVKSASLESQKSLARGIKEELATQFPELSKLNAAESKIYDLQPAIEKAIQRQANHQLGGIGTPIVVGAAKSLTGKTWVAGAAGAMKAIVDNPIIKSRLAIALNKSGVPWSTAQARIQAYSGALAGVSSDANSDTPNDRTNEPVQ